MKNQLNIYQYHSTIFYLILHCTLLLLITSTINHISECRVISSSSRTRGSSSSSISLNNSINNNFLQSNWLNSTILPYINGSDNVGWTANCPCRLCEQSPSSGLRQIICDTGPIHHLPIYQIPSNIESIEIVGQPNRTNNLTLGPLFYRFPELQILIVKYSNVPAIGHATFRYKTSLTKLDLSHNRIESLIDSNFRGLAKLECLNLSHNHLSDLTSAPFQHLTNLRHLNLSHNNIRFITTRLFYNLSRIESLDLSSNPINEINPQHTIDLRPLQRLYMSNCQLRELHSLFYRNVPNLNHLDLRQNQIEIIHSNEYRHLPLLSELRLDHNLLSTLPASAFFGNNLHVLGLSNNRLIQIDSETFLNSTINDLDLSGNNLTIFETDTFTPLSTNLKRLNLANNSALGLSGSSQIIEKLIQPLTILEWINLSNLTLDVDSLPRTLLQSSRSSIQYLNLSHNQLTSIPSKLIEEMYNLKQLDLSYNSLFELDSEFLYELNRYTNLTEIYLDNNPWSCFRCHSLQLRQWITAEDRPINAYSNACQTMGRCALCTQPPSLEGFQLDQLEEWQLEWCTDPTVQLRVSTTEPNVGLVLALLIIIILIFVIIVVIVYYRNRGAIYFTNEDIFYGRSISGIGSGGRNSMGGALPSGGYGGESFDHDIGHDSKDSNAIYNISNRIRYFAQATASPPSIDSAGHSIRSSSIDSVEVSNRRKRSNGYVNTPKMVSLMASKSMGPIPVNPPPPPPPPLSKLSQSQSIDSGSSTAAPQQPAPTQSSSMDSSNGPSRLKTNGYARTQSTQSQSGMIVPISGTILRRTGPVQSIMKKQTSNASSTTSTTNRDDNKKIVHRQQSSQYDEDSNEQQQQHHQNHYERPPTSRYRILNSKSSEDEDEEEVIKKNIDKETNKPKVSLNGKPKLPPKPNQTVKNGKSNVMLVKKKTQSKSSSESSTSSSSSSAESIEKDRTIVYK
ncbi:hypothetical protein BLOT_009897 [Blomia tropicalis]|nr:hypothetical protein BLOT_009897 [Blomia tropicalis]